MAALGSSLPKKEKQEFRQMMKLYDDKKYKKALKVCDSILKVTPTHGQTLAFKGLICASIPERHCDKLTFAKAGLKADMKSPLAWHILGLIHKGDRDYVEAAKCYRVSLSIEPNNFGFLRDLGNLLVHTRQLEANLQTRIQILNLRPQFRGNWLAVAVAQHLLGHPENAASFLNVVEERREQFHELSDDFEWSEIFLYAASCLEEAGQYEAALKYLEAHQSSIVDKMGLWEAQARLFLITKNFADAQQIFARLLERLPNNEGYAYCWLMSHPLPEVRAMFPRLTSSHESRRAFNALLSPPLDPNGRLPTGWSPGAAAMSQWLEWKKDERILTRELTGNKRQKLSRGPARLFWDKLDALPAEELVKISPHLDELESKFPDSDAVRMALLELTPAGDAFAQRLEKFVISRVTKGVPSVFEACRPLITPTKVPIISQVIQSLESKIPADAPPTSVVFVDILAARFWCHLGQFERSLEILNRAIERTPTLPELFLVKSSTLKAMGRLEESASVADEGRQLDISDRYLNCCHVRALMRVERVAEAQSVAQLFSRGADGSGDNLHDMQAMWFEIAAAKAYERRGELHLALRMCERTMSHVEQIVDDQFDFHVYCIKKATLRAYVAFLRMEDSLYAHRMYRAPAKLALRLWLSLAASPQLLAATRAAAAAAAPRVAPAPKKSPLTRKAEQTKVDEDPVGALLIARTPLDEVRRIAAKLKRHASVHRSTHVLAYEAAESLELPEAAALALADLWHLSGRRSFDPKLSPLVVRFLKKFGTPAEGSVVREICGSQSWREFAEASLEALSDDCSIGVVDLMSHLDDQVDNNPKFEHFRELFERSKKSFSESQRMHTVMRNLASSGKLHQSWD